MADGRTDPARLKGAALTRWYNRTPQEVQAEKEAAEQRKHEAFAASIREVERESEDGGLQSPIDMAKDALHDFQSGPKIQRPNTAQSFIPVIGPAWEAAADLQDGNYAGAALNGVMAVADALRVGVAAKGVRAATKGVKVLKKGSLTANAARSRLRDWGVAKKGEEIHHTIPLDGIGRGEQNWRNHYALLKVLPQETRRVCAALEARAENYFEGDDRETEFEPLLSAVRAAGSVGEIYERLQPDTFEPH
jgi:hypothetical protein